MRQKVSLCYRQRFQRFLSLMKSGLYCTEVLGRMKCKIEELKRKKQSSSLNHSVPQPTDDEQFAEIDVSCENNKEDRGSYGIAIPRLSKNSERYRFVKMRQITCKDDAVTLAGSSDGVLVTMFYKQAKFMENFKDNYKERVYSTRYPVFYNQLTNEQLRTYFTWRTKTRKGIVAKSCFPYIILHISELINNIGVHSCKDGWNRLFFIWKNYRSYDRSLDSNMKRWLKDYYITNDFSEPFETLVKKSGNLSVLYRNSRDERLLDFYYPYSSYKIMKSGFYTPKTAKSIGDCFEHVVKDLDHYMAGSGKEFEDLIFCCKACYWRPFWNLVYCSISQTYTEKYVKLSDTERYRFRGGKWTSSGTKIANSEGKRLLGYILRRIEQYYRIQAHSKHKLTADRGKIDPSYLKQRVKDPQALFKRIDNAILEYDREARRIVVTVDPKRVQRIRKNALKTQKKLTVGESRDSFQKSSVSGWKAKELRPAKKRKPEAPEPLPADPWASFVRLLDGTEFSALRMILGGVSVKNLREFLKPKGRMLEVLADHINQKALDTVGDNVMEVSDKIEVFEDYKDDLKRVVHFERR